MPMQLTVSRNRKTSKNYNSEGFGVSLTVELDQSLLTQPTELQKKIDYLYREADTALDQQANGDNSNGNGDRSRGNGHQPRTNSRNGNTITQAQRRAVHAIGQRLGLDIEEECQHEFGAKLNDLTVRQASEFIDHLKTMEQPVGRGGRG